MKIEDVKIGMKIVVPKNERYPYVYTVEKIKPYTKPDVIRCVNEQGIPYNFYVSTIEPYIEPKEKQPEFTWDKSVPTIGKPMEHVGRWFIEIDSKVSIVFNKPISVYKYGFKTECYLIAILKDHAYPFIFTEEATNTKCYLPVTYTRKVIELTVDILKEFYEKENKIKVKIVKE